MVDDAATFVMRLMYTPGVGPVRVANALRWLNQKNATATDALRDPSNLRGALTDEQLSRFVASAEMVDDIAQKLRSSGIACLVIGSDGYPRRLTKALGDKAPPLLTCLGNLALLNARGVGFCGSRKASDRGLAVATDCGEQLSRSGLNIVSGYATGVDMATHSAALRSGGTTTIVLPEGILGFRVKREIKDIWDWNRVAVVGEFVPNARWSVTNAMQRNRTICSLSDAMILIEAGATGGSIEAGKTCLKMGFPLFAPVYEGMPEWATGNREVLSMGARPLLRSRSSGRANMTGVIDVVSTAA